MSMTKAALGTARAGLAPVSRGALVLAAALLFSPEASPQAAPAEPPAQAPAPAASAPSPEPRPDEAADKLRAVLEDRHGQSPLRASAATAFSLRVGTDAVPTLLPLLQDRDEQVRIAAARALGRLGGAQAQQALEEAIPTEESALVREALQQGLTFIEP
jgi:HEAT repeat protein